MELIPLKITEGWEVVKNHFYDIDYQSCLDESGLLSYPFYEDILVIRNRYLRLTIDLGWMPDSDPNGSYQLQLLSWEDEPKIKPMPKQSICKKVDGVILQYKLFFPEVENWDDPLESYESKSRIAIKDKINEFLRWKRT